MSKSVVIRNTVQLKDGRKIHSCGFGFHYFLEAQNGSSTIISEKYYNKLSHSLRQKF